MGENIPEESKESEDLKLFENAVDKMEGYTLDEGNGKDKEEQDTEAALASIKASQKELAKEGFDGSPMHFLRQKELELRGELLEAEKKAEGIVADARVEASKIRTEADEIAAAESKEYFEKEMEKAKKEAQARRDSVKDEVQLIDSTGNIQVGQAEKIVMKAITLNNQ